jgi:hypothetical protein
MKAPLFSPLWPVCRQSPLRLPLPPDVLFGERVLLDKVVPHISPRGSGDEGQDGWGSANLLHCHAPTDLAVKECLPWPCWIDQWLGRWTSWPFALTLSRSKEEEDRRTCCQRCQIKKFKSARSDVKIRQNPPSRIDQIRQKSARNWEDFRPFFTLRVVFVGFLVRILPYLRNGQGKIFIFFENILHNFVFLENILHKIIFSQLFFFYKKK